MSAFIAGALGVVGSFTPWLLLVIFVITMAAEFGLFVPYLLESIWLLAGYNVGTGIVSPFFLVALCLVGMMGREMGSGAVFYASLKGGPFFNRWYHDSVEPRLPDRLAAAVRYPARFGPVKRLLKKMKAQSTGTDGGKQQLRMFGRNLLLSPVTVAMGRFLWLRLPITVGLGIARRIRPLLLGVALFSAVADGIYIVLGVVGGAEGIDHTRMLLYSMGIMAIIFASTLGVRRLARQPVE